MSGDEWAGHCRGWFLRFITAFYFDRIRVIDPENLPGLGGEGPVLYLGLHRNGAVDGFVYHGALRGPVFMISTQLVRNWFSRLFFGGIAVTRAKDGRDGRDQRDQRDQRDREGERRVNEGALRECLGLLDGGGRLFVFPEGTSSLGARHLPFKSGAVWLLLEYLGKGGAPIGVAPVGIHYECPWAFRSKVEVVIGEGITTELPAGASQTERMRTLKHRVQTALEKVGVNVVSEDYQALIQRIACAATLGTRRSYFKVLKALEHGIPEEILARWAALEPEYRNRRFFTYRGVPLYPVASLPADALLLMLLGPIVLAAMASNLPPFLGGWFAGRTFPDDRNVISLWKILAGVPLFILWAGFVAAVLLFAGKFWFLAAYGFLTWAGLKLYDPARKLTVAVYNGIRHPRLRPRFLDFREAVLRSLPP